MTEKIETIDAEAIAAREAIEEAQDFANQSVAAGDAGAETPLKLSAMTPEQLSERFRAVAKTQRERGARELERVYHGTVVVPMDVQIGDLNIASSAQRFLGLADRTIYTLNRFGSRYLSDGESEKVQTALLQLFEVYTKEADQAFELGRAMLTERKEMAELDGVHWFSPEYSTSTLDIKFGVKSRQTLELVQALHKWDQAILEFATLDFNGGGDAQQIETMRRRERRLFFDINNMCVRIIRALSNRNHATQNLLPGGGGEVATEGEEGGEAPPPNSARGSTQWG